MSEDTSVLGRAKAHFREQLDRGLKRIEPPEGEQFSVPEWRCDVFYGPETAAQRDRYLSLILDRKTEGWVEVIIARARTADGKPLFKPVEKSELMNGTHPDVLTRVGATIFNDSGVSVDDAKKS